MGGGLEPARIAATAVAIAAGKSTGLAIGRMGRDDGGMGGWRYHGSINAAFDYYSRALLLRRRPTLLDKPAIAPQPPPCALPESPSTCTALRVAHPGWTERRVAPGR